VFFIVPVKGFAITPIIGLFVYLGVHGRRLHPHRVRLRALGGQLQSISIRKGPS
jgi:hypothetical protein